MIKKIQRHYSRRGMSGLIRQAGKRARNRLFPPWNFLYYIELTDLSDFSEQEDSEYEVVNRDSEQDLEPEETYALSEHLGASVFRRQMNERFEQRRSRIWLAKRGQQVLGFAWTVIQDTVEPFYWPLTENDVHIYHVMVFPEYRGKGIGGMILRRAIYFYKQEGCKRAYIEALADNRSSNRLVLKNGFSTYGVGRRSKYGKIQLGLFRRDWKNWTKRNLFLDV